MCRGQTLPQWTVHSSGQQLSRPFWSRMRGLSRPLRWPNAVPAGTHSAMTSKCSWKRGRGEERRARPLLSMSVQNTL